MAWYQWIINVFRKLFGLDYDNARPPKPNYGFTPAPGRDWQQQQQWVYQQPRPVQPKQQYRPQPRRESYLQLDDFEKLLGEPSTSTHEDNSAEQLRDKARAEGDAMAQCYKDSKVARKLGDRVRAKRLIDQGRVHELEKVRLDKAASDQIFKANNRDIKPNELELHGLYVKEAIERTKDAIAVAQGRGDHQLRIIVGKGLHSQGDAKLKPAIEGLVAKYQLPAALDPRNAGMLVVTLKQGPSQATKPRGTGRPRPRV